MNYRPIIASFLHTVVKHSSKYLLMCVFLNQILTEINPRRFNVLIRNWNDEITMIRCQVDRVLNWLTITHGFIELLHSEKRKKLRYKRYV